MGAACGWTRGPRVVVDLRGEGEEQRKRREGIDDRKLIIELI